MNVLYWLLGVCVILGGWAFCFSFPARVFLTLCFLFPFCQLKSVSFTITLHSRHRAKGFLVFYFFATFLFSQAQVFLCLNSHSINSRLLDCFFLQHILSGENQLSTLQTRKLKRKKLWNKINSLRVGNFSLNSVYHVGFLYPKNIFIPGLFFLLLWCCQSECCVRIQFQPYRVPLNHHDLLPA